MFLIHKDLCSNLKIKIKYSYFYSNKLFIIKYFYNIEILFSSASRCGHYKMVKSLLKNKQIDPSIRNNYAIRGTCEIGHYKIVKLLLKDKRVDPSNNDNYAIRLASTKGYLKIVKLLLKDKGINKTNSIIKNIIYKLKT